MTPRRTFCFKTLQRQVCCVQTKFVSCISVALFCPITDTEGRAVALPPGPRTRKRLAQGPGAVAAPGALRPAEGLAWGWTSHSLFRRVNTPPAV